ncbi:MAG TPA: histidine kinase [Streptosporangiaceae bacterium]|nr:histidine kinase [Streptosporangiaceae bacterium]
MPRSWRLARPGATGSALRWVNPVARGFGFFWVGMLAFVFYPPPGGAALVVQAAGYAAAGLGLAAWVLLDALPAAAPRRPRLLPVALSVIAAGAGCASAVSTIGGIPLVVFAFVAAMAAGSETSVPAVLAVTATGILATEVSGLAFDVSISALVGLPLVIVSGAVVGRNRGAYRIQAEQAAALLAQREQLETEQRRADLLDERARIAREIHDVLAHSLGALGIQIQAARSVLADRGDIGQASELLTAAQRMAAEGLAETRRAVHALRSDTLPLEEELAKVTGTYARRYHVEASFSAGGEPRPVPPEAIVGLLRVAQEALVNAAKHATGQPVTIRLDYAGADVRLAVRNDLAAAPAAGADGSPAVRTANAGYGLTGMRERLRILSGTLEAGRADGQWVVTAQLPLPRPQNAAPTA